MSTTTHLLLEGRMDEEWKLLAETTVSWYDSNYPAAIKKLKRGIPTDADVQSKTAYCANGYAYSPVCERIEALASALNEELEESQRLSEFEQTLKYSPAVKMAMLNRPRTEENCKRLLDALDGISKERTDKAALRVVLFWED